MSKLAKLQAKLSEKGLDALIVTNPYNRRYITGFTGTAGMAIITPQEGIFITDFRYTDQAQEQAKEFKIIEHTQAIELEAKSQLEALQVKNVGFEKFAVTYAEYERFKNVFPVELVPVEGLIEELRVIKSDEEIQILKEAGKIVDDAFEHILSFIKPGVPEIDIANELEFFMRKQGASSSSFDIIVASGYRSALPHGTASTKKINTGELVTMDFGALYKGYCSDITRTVAVGNISDELMQIYQTVLEAQMIGVNEIKPGMTGREADALTRDYITSKGYGKYFGHSTGHGIGLEIHEAPTLSIRSETVLTPGMVVTVEPGIYISNTGGCRIEDDIVITKTGNERLTYASKELIYL